MNEIISPITAAAVGSGGRTSDDGVVGSLIDHFESAIWAERNFYAILLGVWLAFALIGIIVMIWHSGGRDRYVARRGTLITADSAAESKFWPWKKERPLYNEYTEKQFRGTTPTVPRIVEPDQNGNSFFDTGTSRPFVPRKSTFGSTISSLAAPGQAFLRMAGRPTPTPTPTPTLTPTPTPTPTPTLTPTPTPTPDHGRANLVEKGASSEQYNSGVPIDELETPPPFWVNKFFRAVGSARDLLPTRGQRHGAALGRDGSQRTERSFRASFTTPGRDWAGEREGEPAWTMVDPQSIGRALDGINDGPVDSRYPPLPRSYPSTSQPIFPRPMSRAPTLHEGHRIPSREVRAPTPPNKHDSIDYLDDESDFDRAYADERYDHVRPSTPSSVAEAHVENVYRPHTGTTALASVLANMQEKRREVGDPFVTPFDDEHRLGGRI